MLLSRHFKARALNLRESIREYMLDHTSEESFASLGLREELLNNLLSLDYKKMTPIQAQSLPIMLNTTDVIAQANTGSGKTVAFGLGLLNQLTVGIFAVQALVLCPTRELAEQVSQALRRLARLLPNVKILNISGGMPIKAQLDSLKHGAHIIVGTPGRVQKHLDKGTLSLANLRTLVLDEADKMLDMGFFESMTKVRAFCPAKRQTLLFSATFPAEIQKLAREFMSKPMHVKTDELPSPLDIDQVFFEVLDPDQKFASLIKLLQYYQPSSTLIFCNTKEKTTQLTNLLKQDGFSAIVLNGDLEQTDRDQAVIRFGNQSCSILVATDVAARGLDIKELPAVINYELAFDYEVHIHRIGRTGRAGHKGVALSLTTPADAGRLCLIEQGMAQQLNWGNINSLQASTPVKPLPPMASLRLSVGRKEKIRAGDILGALTKDAGLSGKFIGKIDITAVSSFIAVERAQVEVAYQYLKNGKIKGKKVGVVRL